MKLAIAREPGRLPRRLLIDDQTLDLPEMEFCVLKRDGYTWKVESFISSHWPDRTRYVAGGVLNLLREGSPMIVVGGELAPFAADLKGTRFFGNRSLSKLPVRKYTEVSEYELRSHHLILIGGAKLNRVVRKFEEENADWPLPRGEGGFVLDEETTVDPAKSLVGVVTLNPADRRLRTWTFYCDDPKAFHAESAILKNSTRRRRQPDITVIDVEKNELTEHRVLDKKWKPYPKPMGNE